MKTIERKHRRELARVLNEAEELKQISDFKSRVNRMIIFNNLLSKGISYLRLINGEYVELNLTYNKQNDNYRCSMIKYENEYPFDIKYEKTYNNNKIAKKYVNDFNKMIEIIKIV